MSISKSAGAFAYGISAKKIEDNLRPNGSSYGQYGHYYTYSESQIKALVKRLKKQAAQDVIDKAAAVIEKQRAREKKATDKEAAKEAKEAIAVQNARARIDKLEAKERAANEKATAKLVASTAPPARAKRARKADVLEEDEDDSEDDRADRDGIDEDGHDEQENSQEDDEQDDGEDEHHAPVLVKRAAAVKRAVAVKLKVKPRAFSRGKARKVTTAVVAVAAAPSTEVAALVHSLATSSALVTARVRKPSAKLRDMM